MRIGFVAQPFDRMSLPVEEGSLPLWLSQTAKIASRRGHSVFLFANHGGTFGARFAYNEGVRYVYTSTGLNRLLNKLHRAVFNTATNIGWNRQVQQRFESAWHDLGYAIEVGCRLREYGCDIVQIMNYSQFVPVIRSLNPRCKISLHMHCEWLTQLDRTVLEKRIAHADLIVGCSEYITRKISNRFPQFEDRCVTVPNAASVVDEEDLGKTDSNYVLYVGRVSPEKGVHDLIRAFHEVLKRFPEARIHIVGGIGSLPYEFLVGLSDVPNVTNLRVFYEQKIDGKKDPYILYLEREAGEELGKRIFFEGWIPHSRLTEYYIRAAVLVNPSLSESFGISLLEAMMHKVPVVATAVGGMTYTVDHGRTGLLVEPADSQALASAICDVLGNRVEARRMGEAGRTKAIEKFSWERTTDILLDQFIRVVG